MESAHSLQVVCSNYLYTCGINWTLIAHFISHYTYPEKFMPLWIYVVNGITGAF